jgi:hypothetical protein
MNIDSSRKSPSQLAEWTTYEAIAAQRATGADAKAENAKQIAALSDCADSRQQAEHIRGLVAATMSQISIDATPATRENATHWQTWALGLADGFDSAATQATGLSA